MERLVYEIMTYEEFSKAIEATPHGDKKAFYDIWDNVPGRWQRRYKRENWTYYPHLIRFGERGFKHIAFSRQKMWYRFFFQERHIVRIWNRLSCFLNKSHEPFDGKCTICSKKLPNAAQMTDLEKQEYCQLLERYRQYIISKGEGIGPDNSGVILPYPANSEQFQNLKNTLLKLLDE